MTGSPTIGNMFRQNRKVVGIAAGAVFGLFATGALAAAPDENEKQKSAEACLQQVKAADQGIDPVDREETARLLSDAADMCHAGQEAAAERLIKIAQDLDDLRRSVKTE